MNQDRRISCNRIVSAVAALGLVWVAGEYVKVVVVVAGNGQVPHPPVMDPRGGAAVGDRDTAVGGLEMLAGF